MSTAIPLGTLGRGLVAGAGGTLAMDTFWYLRHLAQGGRQDPISWEFGGISAWDKVSAPGQVGKRLVEVFTQRPFSERWARLTNNLMHWGYGIAWGEAFAALVDSSFRVTGVVGPLFGVGVWGSSYVVLPIMGLYKPIWRYAPKELAPDLAAHLIYGTATVLGLRAMRG